jgi:hypothetical protein
MASPSSSRVAASPSSRVGSPSNVAPLPSSPSSSFFARKAKRSEPAKDGSKGTGAPDQKVFGVDLRALMERDCQRDPQRMVPYVVEFLRTKLFELKCYEAEGIFRLAASAELVPLVAAQLDSGNFDVVVLDDVNLVAALFKRFLRELPTPLCPNYAQCIKAVSPAEVEAAFTAVPPHSQALVRYLAALCGELAPHEGQTKMGMQQVTVRAL